jgi:hypothetical protein
MRCGIAFAIVSAPPSRPARDELCFADRLTASLLPPGTRSWAARALADKGVDLEIVDLPDGVRDKIRDAQRRQFR